MQEAFSRIMALFERIVPEPQVVLAHRPVLPDAARGGGSTQCALVEGGQSVPSCRDSMGGIRLPIPGRGFRRPERSGFLPDGARHSSDIPRLRRNCQSLQEMRLGEHAVQQSSCTRPVPLAQKQYRHEFHDSKKLLQDAALAIGDRDHASSGSCSPEFPSRFQAFALVSTLAAARLAEVGIDRSRPNGCPLPETARVASVGMAALPPSGANPSAMSSRPAKSNIVVSWMASTVPYSRQRSRVVARWLSRTRFMVAVR